MCVCVCVCVCVYVKGSSVKNSMQNVRIIIIPCKTAFSGQACILEFEKTMTSFLLHLKPGNGMF